MYKKHRAPTRFHYEFAVIAAIAFFSLLFFSPAFSQSTPGDLNADGKVDVLDLGILLSNWNTSNATADINGDGIVNVLDLGILLSHWGQGTTQLQPPSLSATQRSGQLAVDISATCPSVSTWCQLRKMGSGSPVLSEGANLTQSAVDTDVQANQTYTYNARYWTSSGAESPHTERSVTIQGVSAPPPPPPPPPPPSGSVWPNLPAGYSIFDEQRWDESACQGRWTSTNCDDNANAVIARDQSDEPVSPPTALRFRQAEGSLDGRGPAHTNFNLGLVGSPSRIYVGFTFKIPKDYEHHPSNVTKVVFIRNLDAGNNSLMTLDRSGSGYVMTFRGNSANFGGLYWSNVNGAPLTQGEYHEIEVQLERTSGTIWNLRWWVNGTLRGEHLGLDMGITRLGSVRFNPMWGGNMSVTKSQTDYIYFGHSVLAQ